MTNEISDPNARWRLSNKCSFCHLVILLKLGIEHWELSSPALPRQLSPVRLCVPPMFRRGGLFVDERFAAHLDEHLFHLPGETIADITGDAIVLQQGRLHRLHGSLHFLRFFARD